MNQDDIYWVYVTAGSQDEARTLAQTLVQERLAACANLLQNMESIYYWNDALQLDREVVLILKTRGAHFEKLKQRVLELHSYDCPCILALPVMGGHSPFLQWIREQTR
ncbi:MAG: divalent-cation tolerance protein CutA [Desulfobacterales bacterium]|jgi:periplasmic divalent cation tolerance protein